MENIDSLKIDDTSISRVKLRGKTSYLTKILGSDFIAVLGTLEYGAYGMKNENIARVGRHILMAL